MVACFTAGDLGLSAQPSPFSPPFTQCPLALDVVRFVGEPIVAVLSETRAAGADMADAVVVDYEPLPVVIGVDDALAGDVLLFPEVGTNVCGDSTMMGLPGPDPDLFADCDVVVSERIVNQRVAPCPLEVRAGAAAWTADGRLVQWSTSQTPRR